MSHSRTIPLRNKITKPLQRAHQSGNMSYLFHPYRHHSRMLGGHPPRHWPFHGPTSYTFSPWPSHADAFGFSQPFLSLFNDTFSQLDRLSNELNTQLGEAFNDKESPWANLLTQAPKFDVKETDEAYILEGELPGVEKENISLDFVDDSTLVLKTKTETFREQGSKPQSEPQQQLQPKPNQAQVEDAPDADVEMSGANPDASDAPAAATIDAAQSSSSPAVTAAEGTSTDLARQQPTPSNELTKPTPTYHLTERTLGTFQRAFSFPASVNHAAVTASLKNGVLTVTVPKVEVAKKPEEQQKEEGRSVSVTVEDAPKAEAEAEKAKL